MCKLTHILRVFALLCASVLLLTQSTAAGVFAVDLDEKGIALKGYDPVAYFMAGKSTLGSADYSANVDSATYRFASDENRRLFITSPEKYTPAYGGYCALGVTLRMKITGDPEAWKIVNNKLYINSSPKSLVEWSEDIPGNIKTANGVWPSIKDKDPAQL